MEIPIRTLLIGPGAPDNYLPSVVTLATQAWALKQGNVDCRGSGVG